LILVGAFDHPVRIRRERCNEKMRGRDMRVRAAGRRRGFPVFLLLGALASGCGPTSEERQATIHEASLAEIRHLLGDPQRDVRAAALAALVRREVPDARALARRALHDEDGFVRGTAVRLLGELEDLESAGPLAERLIQDPDPQVRQQAAEALGALGAGAPPEALAVGLDDPVDMVRAACVGALAPGTAQDALLRRLAEDPSWEVRAAAAQALAAKPDPIIVAAIEAALADPNEYVRAAAAGALGRSTPAAHEPSGGSPPP
jgi:HEAT repeat protein